MARKKSNSDEKKTWVVGNEQ